MTAGILLPPKTAPIPAPTHTLKGAYQVGKQWHVHQCACGWTTKLHESESTSRKEWREHQLDPNT